MQQQTLLFVSWSQINSFKFNGNLVKIISSKYQLCAYPSTDFENTLQMGTSIKFFCKTNKPKKIFVLYFDINPFNEALIYHNC